VPDEPRKDANTEAKEMAFSLGVLGAVCCMFIQAALWTCFLEELKRNPTWGLWAVVRFFRNLVGL
jgi:hypothetical protein